MSTDFVLAHEINLNNFVVKIYHFDDDQPYVDSETVNNLIGQLNQCVYAREIIDIVGVLQGISQTEVFDLNNNLILINKVVFE
jgi:hypothetical protein